MRTGTCHFVSKNHALIYFRYENATAADIDRKIAEGLIHIGKPDLKPGELLSIIDDGTRYAIEYSWPRTSTEIEIAFGPTGWRVHHVTVPAGTRVSPTGDGQWFVEDLSWLDRNSLVWHDANYYGIRLTTDQVTVP